MSSKKNIDVVIESLKQGEKIQETQVQKLCEQAK
jgi:hypothetical protein